MNHSHPFGIFSKINIKTRIIVSFQDYRLIIMDTKKRIAWNGSCRSLHVLYVISHLTFIPSRPTIQLSDNQINSHKETFHG